MFFTHNYVVQISDLHTSTDCLTRFNFPCLCQYPTLSTKRTTKSWRHPLRKPTARAVPTAVKQQVASDEGGLILTNTHGSFKLVMVWLRRDTQTLMRARIVARFIRDPWDISCCGLRCMVGGTMPETITLWCSLG